MLVAYWLFIIHYKEHIYTILSMTLFYNYQAII